MTYADYLINGALWAVLTLACVAIITVPPFLDVAKVEHKAYKISGTVALCVLVIAFTVATLAFRL